MSLRSRVVVTLLFAVDIVYLLLRDLDLIPYDDAYFFKRFARNFSEHGTLSWNVADGPVHGLTSQLYGAVSLVLRGLAPQHFVVAGKLFAACCLVGCVWRLADKGHRVAGFALLSLTFAGPLVSTTLHTGMETALTLLVLSAALSSFVAQAEQPRAREELRAAAWCLLVYLCRPDAALIAAGTFVLLRRGTPLIRFSLLLACLLGAWLVLCKLYYGTALPLPFYAKTLGQSPYGSALRRLGAADKRLHFASWVAFAAPLLALSRPRESRVARALCGAGAVFVLYHLLLTNEIMGYRARFYVPALVPFGLAALHSLAQLDHQTTRRKLAWLGGGAGVLAAGYALQLLPSRADGALEGLRASAYVTPAALAACACFERELTSHFRRFHLAAVAGLALALSIAAHPPRRSAVLNDDQFLTRSIASVTTTRGLFDVARCLPLHNLYHSEIGVPGLVLPGVRIVDLAGLMSEELALEHPPFDAYCSRDRPEALYLPHKTYAEQNREIAASRCLRDYTRVISQSSSPLYVRNDLASRFRSCAQDTARWR